MAEKMDENNSLKNKIVSYINTKDSDRILVFVLNNKIISYIHYPRKKGDFNIPIKGGYTPVQAVLKLKK